MKAKIKKTGEIVNIADYATIVLDSHDSWGNPIEVKPEEIELIQEQTEDEHWQDVRERAAIAAMQSLIREIYDASNQYLFSQSIAVDAVEYADSLIEKLKKNNEHN